MNANERKSGEALLHPGPVRAPASKRTLMSRAFWESLFRQRGAWTSLSAPPGPAIRQADKIVRAPSVASLLLCAVLGGHSLSGLAAEIGQSPLKESLRPETNEVTVLEIEGVAEFSRKGSQRWDPSYTQQVLYPGDQLRTGERSRAAVRLSDRTLCRLGELSYLQVPGDEPDRGTFRFMRGLLYLFHRDKSDQFKFRTPVVSALVRGTEFNLKVTEDGTTTLSVIEGAAELRNEWGTLDVRCSSPVRFMAAIHVRILEVFPFHEPQAPIRRPWRITDK